MPSSRTSVGLCVQMLNEFQNTKQLNVSFSFGHSFIFAPVNPESYLGSLRSFIFEMIGHSCMTWLRVGESCSLFQNITYLM